MWICLVVLLGLVVLTAALSRPAGARSRREQLRTRQQQARSRSERSIRAQRAPLDCVVLRAWTTPADARGHTTRTRPGGPRPRGWCKRSTPS